MRLIDADKIHPDVRTKRGGLAISQGQLAYAPTVEAIPKDQYEARLKADMVAMLTEMQIEIEECVDGAEGSPQFEQGITIARVQVIEIIQQKIDKLKENNNGKYEIK